MMDGRCRAVAVPWRTSAGAVAGALVLLAAQPLMAGEIYRSVDEHGNVMFSDQPPDDDAEAEPLGDIIVVQPPPRRDDRSADREDPAETGGDDDVPYEGVQIVFPPADEATRRVTGEVPVRVELSPAGTELREGHRVRVEVDGRHEGEAPATEITVGPLNPGPRTIRATVVDRDGAALVRSEEIRFHLIRQTVNN